jgi:hypothetical protein
MISDILRSFGMSMEYGRNLLADLDHNQMTAQPLPGMNHPAWIVGHLAFSFQMIGGELGLEPWLPEHWANLFGTGSILNAGRYPRKHELLAALAAGEKKLTEHLATMDESDLDQPLPDERCRHTLPTLGSAVLHILTVHTAVHLGQLSAWRRAMGLPPVPDPV